jgi:hypothetical protein
MSRQKTQICIELPSAPLSKRDNNKVSASSRIDQKMPKTQRSPSTMSVEIPVKIASSSKVKNKADDQNTKPIPGASDRALKRKRSTSDLVGNSVIHLKKTRGLERTKPRNKVSLLLLLLPPQLSDANSIILWLEHSLPTMLNLLKLWMCFRSPSGYPFELKFHTILLCKGCRFIHRLFSKWASRLTLTKPS